LDLELGNALGSSAVASGAGVIAPVEVEDVDVGEDR